MKNLLAILILASTLSACATLGPDVVDPKFTDPKNRSSQEDQANHENCAKQARNPLFHDVTRAYVFCMQNLDYQFAGWESSK